MLTQGLDQARRPGNQEVDHRSGVGVGGADRDPATGHGGIARTQARPIRATWEKALPFIT